MNTYVLQHLFSYEIYKFVQFEYEVAWIARIVASQQKYKFWLVYLLTTNYKQFVLLMYSTNKKNEIKMTHQATANRFSLFSRMVSVVVRILFTGLDYKIGQIIQLKQLQN